MNNHFLKITGILGMTSALLFISSQAFATGNNKNKPSCSEPIVGTWSCVASRVSGQSAPLLHTFTCDGTALYQSQSTLSTSPLPKAVGSRGIGQGYWKKISKDLYIVGTDEYIYDQSSDYNGVFKALVKIKYDKVNDGLKGSAFTQFFSVTNVGTNHTDLTAIGSAPTTPLPVWTCDPADEGDTLNSGVGTFPLGRIQDAQSDFFGRENDLPVPLLPGE